MPDLHPGRVPLVHWQERKSRNFYADNPLLQRIVDRLTDGAADHQPLADFGAETATNMDAAAQENDRVGNHPRFEPYTGIGVHTEGIVFHPAYHAAGGPAYEAGILSCMAEPGNTWFQSVLFYLLCHCGEMGHACPITCTAGMIRAIQQKGSKELKDTWLPGLLTSDYDEKLHGSQFLTEVQGGSDVGANIVEARSDDEVEGAFRIHGEKWFCSVADAPLYLVVARPEGAPAGSAGLGCFLVPRHLADGSVNGFRIRRLKEKIGTRSMASAEIDFLGSLAWPIGELSEGFKIAVGIVLNTSRLMNALGSTGAMRRAYLEAVSYAAAREAFGNPIGRYPLVRENLATMKAEEAGALISTFFLADLVDRIDTERASDDDVLLHRLLVNANKYWTSIVGTDLVHRGIETLGGNGAIETFSVLPRLYRDSIVLESWEGAHNVLAMQVLRDAAKLDLLGAVDRWLRPLADSTADVAGDMDVDLVAAWQRARQRLARCVEDPMGHGALHVRRAIEELMQLVQVALLLEQARWEAGRDLETETAAIAHFLFRRHLDPAWTPEDDPGYLAAVDAVIAGDLERFSDPADLREGV